MTVAEWGWEVRRVALGVASAMEYLHTRNVLHRDLKPENILLTANNTVRVADFGVSVQFLDDPSLTGNAGGTPVYMSPELMLANIVASGTMANPAAGDMSSDVYAYGVILCELVNSDSAEGMMNKLMENAASNRNLSALQRSGTYGDDLETAWRFPPFCDGITLSLYKCSNLGRRCCAFHPRERPSFSDICRQLSGPTEQVQQLPQIVDNGRRWRSVSDANSSSVNYTPAPRSPRLSVASIDSTTEFGVEGNGQVLVRRCAGSCWSRHKLSFADADMERQFLAFLHSEEFFRYLRWPYVVLALLQLVVTAVAIGLKYGYYAASPAALAVVFSAAATFSWVRRLQRQSMVTLAVLALAAVITQCVTVLGDIFELCLVELHPNDTLSTKVYVGNLFSAPPEQDADTDTCRITLFQWFYTNLLLPLLTDLTTPVTLLVLGLPFYLYVWLLAVTAVSWMGTVAGGVFLHQYLNVPGELDFAVVTLPGVALFPICAITAIAAERKRRKMFLKLFSLRTEENHLLERATFRGYREALLANWRLLAATGRSSGNRSQSRHAVTAATI